MALLVSVLLVLAGPFAGTSAAQEDPCAGLNVIETETGVLCTHGGDPARAVDLPPEPAPGRVPGAAAAQAPCPDGGVSGKRIEVIYAVPQDRPNNYAASLASVRAAVTDADNYLDQSTPGMPGQHYRWLCENGSDVTVRNVTLIPIGSDGAFDFADMVTSLQNQVALGLGTQDFMSPDRLYLVFVDQIAGAYPFGGQGNILNDDTPDPAANLHQLGAPFAPRYSLINGFSGAIAEHELGHNIGAVQLSAPHSSGAWHCYEENDEMCYADGGPYFQGGGALVFDCPTLPPTHFDCNQDDYYSLVPVAGTYLASHWNVSNSVFLTAPPRPRPALDHFKCYDARHRGTVKPRVVSLRDQFGSGRALVGRPRELCNPVDKNDEGINRPKAHLVSYRIKPIGLRPPTGTLAVENQFGRASLTVGRPKALLVPSSKAHVGAKLEEPPQQLDHFLCYRVVGHVGDTPASVVLKDQFVHERVRVGKATLFCNPVEKNDEPVQSDHEHLTCYSIMGNRFSRRDVVVHNQFGVRRLRVLKQRSLCVPSTKRPPQVDAIIDADGTTTAQSGDPGARDVTAGDPLASFPVPTPNDSGLDMFDQDANNAWTLGPGGDDLHVEGPTFCPTAIRDGVHQLGLDCKVLDIDGNLADGQQVTCDLEVGVSFGQIPCPPPDVKYHDRNANSAWDDGEDIVLDVNNNGVFD